MNIRLCNITYMTENTGRVEQFLFKLGFTTNSVPYHTNPVRDIISLWIPSILTKRFLKIWNQSALRAQPKLKQPERGRNANLVRPQYKPRS